MTTDKAHKRAIRARMTKTGEAYTTARQHVAGRAGRATATVDPSGAATDLTISPLPPRLAEPDVSEASVMAGTGRGWDDWFRILDAAGIADAGHAAIARWLSANQPISGWWSQQVTVGYERARGLRDVNQRDDGHYVGVSKTVVGPVAAVREVVVDPRGQADWIEPGSLRPRTSTARDTVRFDFRDGSSRVAIHFAAKGQDRTTVTVEHYRLGSRHDVEAMRTFWRERLSRLASVVP